MPRTCTATREKPHRCLRFDTWRDPEVCSTGMFLKHPVKRGQVDCHLGRRCLRHAWVFIFRHDCAYNSVQDAAEILRTGRLELALSPD